MSRTEFRKRNQSQMIASVWESAKEMAIAELRQNKREKRAKEQELQLESLRKQLPDEPDYELMQYVHLESASIDLSSEEDD